MHRLPNIISKHFLIILLALFIVSSGVAVVALRSNNLNMIKLRQAVYDADKQDGDVASALDSLRIYVYGHMNTGLRAPNSGSQPPIQLVNSFNRAIAAEQTRIATSDSANKLYVDAQKQCELASLALTARAQCIQDYVTAHGQGGEAQFNLPPKELYTFDFASPVWSPDLAGIMLVAAALTALAIIVTVFIRLAKHLLYR